jgi:hypothetical protein
MKRKSHLRLPFFVPVVVCLILRLVFVPEIALGYDMSGIRQDQKGIDFEAVAQKFPQFKTLFAVEFNRPLELKDLIGLLNRGVWPVDSRLLNALGKSQGIFYTRAYNLEKLTELSLIREYVPLVRFQMRGLYRIHLKVIEPGFNGPLAFSVSSPRNGFGKTLLRIEDHVSPKTAFTVGHDHAGNRWLELEFPDLSESKTAKFDFYFVYQVDVKKLLKHALPMLTNAQISELPGNHEAMVYLYPSEKIESLSPLIQEKSKEIFGEESSPSVMYFRLARFIKQNITYDSQKRQEFFGGMKVYNNMSQMYEKATVTLQRKVGACPDTSILETALLRAAHIPSRTASRWGHIFTEIYIPSYGWASTSITPTGIPLTIDPDNHNYPFVSWNRKVSVQTLLWEGVVDIDIGEMNE